MSDSLQVLIKVLYILCMVNTLTLVLIIQDLSQPSKIGKTNYINYYFN